MSNVNTSAVNRNVSGNANVGMHQLFFGDDKLTATYLILIGSMINFFLNMKQRKFASHEILVHLLIIVCTGLFLSNL